MDFSTTDTTVQTNSVENIKEGFHMTQGTTEVAIQIGIGENTQADCCMTEEAAKATIQIDPFITQDDEV